MEPIGKVEARSVFESADEAAVAVVEAQLGWYDPTSRAANSLYAQVFDNLLDDRLEAMTMPDLLAHVNS